MIYDVLIEWNHEISAACVRRNVVGMEKRIDNLEDLSAFKLSDDDRERLFESQNECTVCWTNKDGWPVGMPHSFVWSDGKFWVHTTTNRKRVRALRARPQSCVVVSSLGTEIMGAMSN